MTQPYEPDPGQPYQPNPGQPYQPYQPDPRQPYQAPPQQFVVQHVQQQTGNGLGTAGFVLGLIGLLFSWIPFFGIIAWFLVIPGAVFSGIGIAKANRGEASNRGLAIAGLVLSIIGLVICFMYVAGLASVGALR